MRQISIVTANRLVTLASASLALFVGLALMPTPFTQRASAQGYDPNYRFCTERGPVRYQSQTPDCRYTSMQQCSYSVGPGVRCIENPFYAPTKAKPRRTARRTRAAN